MLLRSALAWLGILVLAILNGAFRQGALIPRFGDQIGHVLSTILLAALVFLAARVSLAWVHPLSRSDAWSIGFQWLTLTLAFEFLAGHFLFKTSWDQLLADYNLTRGRIWVLIPITTLFAPVIIYALRRPTP